jgi:hypothetical protein
MISIMLDAGAATAKGSPMPREVTFSVDEEQQAMVMPGNPSRPMGNGA